MDIDPAFIVNTPDQLAAISGQLTPASTLKEADYLHRVYQRVVAASPFFAMATLGPAGLDVSPRGDPAGFVQVADANTLLLPERRGNNRIDSLRNLVHDPRLALLFLVPGVGETLRVNGSARISIDPVLLQRFVVQGQPPKCVVVMSVHKVFFQCARALARSGLWDTRPAEAVRTVPTAGEMLAAVTQGDFDGAGYDRELPARQKSTLY